MSKPKKSRTADKYVESLMSELQSQQSAARSSQDNESSFDHNDVLDVQGHKTSVNVPADNSTTAQVDDAPDGLSVTTPIVAEQKSDFDYSSHSDDASDRTQPMGAGLGKARSSSHSEASVKVSYGSGRLSGRSPASSAGQQSEGQLVQAENLKLAQVRILELENELERIRQENEMLASAGSIAKHRLDELVEKMHLIERSKSDALEQSDLEMKILRESLMDKDRELIKAKKKISELESRLNTDLKKIRVRERELENRLELARMEKSALSRTKDETILDLKRKLDMLSGEIENHRQKASDLQSKIDQQQDQLGRTVRALRLALTNLESTDSTSGQLVPIKKAE